MNVSIKTARSSGSGTGTALWGVLAVVGGVVLYRRLRPSGTTHRTGPLEARRTLTIGRPAEELLAFWEQPAQLARILERVAQVTPSGPGGLTWTLRAGGLTWETPLPETVPGQRAVWASPPGSATGHRGELRLKPAPGGRGTEATLHLRFDLPGSGGAARGALGQTALNSLVGDALRRFKSLIETGEIPTLDGSPSGRSSDHTQGRPVRNSG